MLVIKIMVKFKDIEEQLLIAFRENLKNIPIENEENLTLIQGIIELRITSEFPDNSISKFLGEVAMVPTVALRGKNSGQIYLYALKAILPELEI